MDYPGALLLVPHRWGHLGGVPSGRPAQPLIVQLKGGMSVRLEYPRHPGPGQPLKLCGSILGLRVGVLCLLSASPLSVGCVCVCVSVSVETGREVEPIRASG